MNIVYVVTVCLNAAPFIEETIRSVLEQTFPYVKYIIIDGASTDGTIDIIKRYQDNLTFWISEPDKGIYDAMNKGLSIVRKISNNRNDSYWVNYMNAGDTFSDDRVIEDIFAGNNIDDGTEVIGGHTNRVFKDHVELINVMPGDVIPAFIPFSHQSCFMRLGAWHFDLKYKIAADYKILYDFYFEKGISSIKTVDRIISNFKMDGSFTFNNQKLAKREYLKIQSAHKSWFWWKEYFKWIIMCL